MLAHLIERRVVAMDWDAREVRIAHAAIRKKTLRVLSVHSVVVPEDVSPGDRESFGRLIREALAQEGIATRNVLVDIPRDQAVVKMLRGLPPASPETLPGVIAMQVERELSFPASQAAIDFSAPILNPQTNQYDVLVAAVQHDVLDDYVGICEAAGLKPERVGLRPHASRLSLNAVLGGSQAERVLLVDVGPTMTEIDVVSHGHLVFTRAASVHVPAGLSDAPPPVRMPRHRNGDAEESREQPPDSGTAPPRSALGAVVRSLVVEVTRSIEAYRADEPGASVSHIVVGGGTGVEEALAQALRDRFDVTTELFNPAAVFGWDADRGAAACGFAAVLGLVLDQADETGAHFDFLHRKRLVTAAEKQLRKAPLAAAVAVVFVLAAAVGYYRGVKPEKDRLDAVERDIAATQQEITANKKFVKRLQQVDEYERSQVVWLDELHDVLELLPDTQEIVLEGIDMSQKEGRMVLKIKAKNRELMTSTVNSLKNHRLEGRDAAHFSADLGATREVRGAYPVQGNIEVTVMGRRPRPDLTDSGPRPRTDRSSDQDEKSTG